MFSNLLLHQFQTMYTLLPIYQLMYPKVMLTNHQMEDNLKIHLEEVHLEEIRLNNHLLIHMLNILDG
jgi:hypothetical protein